MKTVGAYEAKTHLSALLDAVIQGEEVVITRHGQAIAKLSPIQEKQPETSAVIAALRKARQGNRLDGIPLRALIEAGRD